MKGTFEIIILTAGVMTLFPPRVGVGQQAATPLAQPAPDLTKDSLIKEIRLKDLSIDKKIKRLSQQIEVLKKENKNQALLLREKEEKIARLREDKLNKEILPKHKATDTVRTLRKTNFFKNLFNRKNKNVTDKN